MFLRRIITGLPVNKNSIRNQYLYWHRNEKVDIEKEENIDVTFYLVEGKYRALNHRYNPLNNKLKGIHIIWLGAFSLIWWTLGFLYFICIPLIFTFTTNFFYHIESMWTNNKDKRKSYIETLNKDIMIIDFDDILI